MPVWRDMTFRFFERLALVILTATLPVAGVATEPTPSTDNAAPVVAPAVVLKQATPVAPIVPVAPPVADHDDDTDEEDDEADDVVPPTPTPTPAPAAADADADADAGTTDQTAAPATTTPASGEAAAAAALLKEINEVAAPPATDTSVVAAPVATQKPFLLLGAEVAPGIATRLSWKPRVTFSGIEAPTPVLVINGTKPGPVMCLTGAVHGDELNGIEIVRRVMYDIDPAKLSGTLIGIPIVNLQGFERGTRYLPDRRDLNRFFPGNPRGSMASRIAHSLFKEIILHCHGLVDLHTASFHRTNLPQVRADMRNPAVAKFTEGFDKMVVVHNRGGSGTLRRAAVEAGIPAVTLETGEPMRLQEDKVQSGVRAIYALLERQGMYSRMFSWGEPQPVYYKSRWVRTHHGGILMSTAKLGTRVRKGDVLGTVTDPITNQSEAIRSPYDGRVVGMAVNQVVMPGFAAYHMGIDASEQTVAEPEPADPAAVDDTDQLNEEIAPEE